MRLYALDLIDFRYDEASGVRFALAVAGGARPAALPFTGSVANHPPVYAYALAPAALLSRDLLVIAAYRVMLDVLAVALCGWMCVRHFSVRHAGLACLLFAMAPWAVLLSRNMGVVTPPLFTTILLFGLLEVVRRRNPWGWAAAGWGLALSVGSHWSAAYLVPAAALAVVIGWRQFRPLPVVLGVLPCAILAIVYLSFDAPGNFANLRALMGAAGGSAAFDPSVFSRALWQSGGMGIESFTSTAYAEWRDQVPAVFGAIDALQVLSLLCGLAYVSVRCGLAVARRKTSPGSSVDWTWAILLAMWLAPVAFQLPTTRTISPHYLLTLYPTSFVIASLWLDDILRATRTRGRRMHLSVQAGVCVCLALIGTWQMFNVVRFAAFVEEHDTSAGGYGLPIRNALAVARQATAAVCDNTLCDGPRDVIVVAPGGDPQVNEQAAIMDVLLAGVPHRFADSGAGLILREDAAQYVFTPGAEQALAGLASVAAAKQASSLPARSGSARMYTQARFDAGAERVASDGWMPASGRWENGALLERYRTRYDPGEKVLRVEVLLGVEQAAAPGADYHWYNHVLNAAGAKVGQLDGGGIHPANWRAGDVLWHWFDIHLPELKDAQSLRIGSYWYPDVRNVPMTLPDGSISDGISLPIEPKP